MSFSLKQGRDINEFVDKNINSQSSFSWAFLWNGSSILRTSPCWTSSVPLNPLFHELFSETQTPNPRRLPNLNSQSSFSWAFLWNNRIKKKRPGAIKDITLNPLFHELFSETYDKELSCVLGVMFLSILFFMSFSLKLKDLKTHPWPLYHLSQSSFSWAFLWNCRKVRNRLGRPEGALNPLFHELFSETKSLNLATNFV